MDEDTTTLLLSELITNALLYGVPPVPAPLLVIGVQIDETAQGVHVEVHDPDLGAIHRVMARHGVDPDAEGGRGLDLVEALATDWGVRETATGKCVFFDVASAECAARQRPRRARLPLGGSAAVYAVECGPGRSRAVVSCRVEVVV